MVRNDPIPSCKVYVYATNKVMTRTGREQGIKGKAIDLWCADSVFEAQDAVRTLSSNKNYSNADYSEHKPSFPKTASIAVTTHKPTFVFGSESHQKFMQERAEDFRKKYGKA